MYSLLHPTYAVSEVLDDTTNVGVAAALSRVRAETKDIRWVGR